MVNKIFHKDIAEKTVWSFSFVNKTCNNDVWLLNSCVYTAGNRCFLLQGQNTAPVVIVREPCSWLWSHDELSSVWGTHSFINYLVLRYRRSPGGRRAGHKETGGRSLTGALWAPWEAGGNKQGYGQLWLLYSFWAGNRQHHGSPPFHACRSRRDQPLPPSLYSHRSVGEKPWVM